MYQVSIGVAYGEDIQFDIVAKGDHTLSKDVMDRFRAAVLRTVQTPGALSPLVRISGGRECLSGPLNGSAGRGRSIESISYSGLAFPSVSFQFDELPEVFVLTEEKDDSSESVRPVL